MGKSDNFFTRAKRIVAGGIDSALTKAERATGPALLKQAVRDLEASRERLQRARRDALSNHKKALELRKQRLTEAKSLGGDAAYALSKGHDELARDVLARQMARETEAGALAEEAAGLKAQAAELDKAIADLDPEIEQVRADVAAAIAAGGASVTGAVKRERQAGDMVAKVRSLLDRMSADEGAHADVSAMRREEELEARLAELKAKGGKTPKPKGKAKRK